MVATFVGGKLTPPLFAKWLSTLNASLGGGSVMASDDSGKGFFQWTATFDSTTHKGMLVPTWITLKKLPVQFTYVASTIASSLGKVLAADAELEIEDHINQRLITILVDYTHLPIRCRLYLTVSYKIRDCPHRSGAGQHIPRDERSPDCDTGGPQHKPSPSSTYARRGLHPRHAQLDKDGFITVGGRGHEGKPWTPPQAKLPLEPLPTTATLPSLANEVQSNVGNVNIHTPPTVLEDPATTLTTNLPLRDEPLYTMSPTNSTSNSMSSAQVSPIGSLDVVESEPAVAAPFEGQPPPPQQASLHPAIVSPSISPYINVIQDQAFLHLALVTPFASHHVNVTQDQTPLMGLTASPVHLFLLQRLEGQQAEDSCPIPITAVDMHLASSFSAAQQAQAFTWDHLPHIDFNANLAIAPLRQWFT
uniref:Uncharacterized protein n=1 Tax=Physcomitrium patens TaxID=3218 RepID=A0A2K1L841_PHYPA|nr:hypothetical protein PHYPA_000630 [Physcomitrium patens]